MSIRLTSFRAVCPVQLSPCSLRPSSMLLLIPVPQPLISSKFDAHSSLVSLFSCSSLLTSFPFLSFPPLPCLHAGWYLLSLSIARHVCSLPCYLRVWQPGDYTTRLPGCQERSSQRDMEGRKETLSSLSGSGRAGMRALADTSFCVDSMFSCPSQLQGHGQL